MAKQDGRKIRKDITVKGLAGRMERSGVSPAKAKQAANIVAKKAAKKGKKKK